VNFSYILKRSLFFEDQEKGQVKDQYDVDQIIGASMLIKMDVLRKIGLMEPLYFMYFEDTDFCRKALCCGYRLVCIPKSKVDHNHTLVGSSAKSEKFKYVFLRSEVIFHLKDPAHSFCYNLKSIFIWKGLQKMIERENVSQMTHFKIIARIIFVIPLAFIKHRADRKIIKNFKK